MSPQAATAQLETASPQAESLVTVAYDALVAAILEGTVGSDIIQEGRIAQQLGLSRTPVREALGRLEGEGLLVRSGRVLVVKKLSVTDYLEILHLRLLLECEAVRLASGMIPKATLLDIRAKVVEMDDPAEVTPEQHWALDDLVHNTIARANSNQLLAHLIVDLRRKTRLFDIRQIPARFFPGREEHLKIIDCLIADDGPGAVEAMRFHMVNVKAGILQRIQGGR